MVTYEYPLNERIRTLLRLEDLFGKMAHFVGGSDPLEHHTALMALFELLEVARRADLKFDLVQELERQRQILLGFRNNPDISEEALSGTLYEIENASAALLAMVGKIGQYLKDNEWLMGIKSRAIIPGGVCEFDLPSYHFWLNREAAQRQNDLGGWLAPLLPIREGMTIVLRLLRASGRQDRQVASKGAFHLMLTGRPSQMVRLSVPKGQDCVPEISANKYALNIRFISTDWTERPHQTEADVNFDLSFCSL